MYIIQAKKLKIVFEEYKLARTLNIRLYAKVFEHPEN